jgi:hypothetical protein
VNWLRPVRAYPSQIDFREHSVNPQVKPFS